MTKTVVQGANMSNDNPTLPWGEDKAIQGVKVRETVPVSLPVGPGEKEKRSSKEVTYHNPGDLIIVGLDTDDGKENALFDERIFLEENEALVRNIMVYGIQQPVLCREEAGQLHVVDGRQRVRAARIAARRQDSAGEFAVKVPIITARGDDSRVHGIMISANEIREPDEILGKALKAARMLDLVGGMAEVSIAFGRSEQTIRNWLSLAEADSTIHDAVREGEISASAAIELSNLPREEQVAALQDLSSGKQTTTTQAKKHKAKTGNRKTQPGVKRMWAKKAVKSTTFKSLNKEHQEVLEWIVSGNPSSGSWMDDFVSDFGEEQANPEENDVETPDEVGDTPAATLPF
jgi:ParB family chromosome partitioning protein